MKKKEIRVRCWIDVDGEKFFGPGPAQLLTLIGESGSITKAAREMGMSYMKKYMLCSTVFMAALLLLTVSVVAQTKPFISIEGEVTKTLKLTADDLAKYRSAEVKGKDRDGKEHTFKGVRLVDILDSAGVTLGGKLRGENLAKFVLVKAVDGYEVIFSLPEIDPEFTNQTMLLALHVDGKPLPKGEGPFRMVVPNDKKQARWIREIVSIKVAFSKE